MPKPISIAMLLSAAIHLVLFMIGEWLLSGEAPPAITSTALLVHIEPSQTTGDTADESRVVPALESETTNPLQGPPASRASEKRSEMAEPTEMLIAAEISPRDLKPATEKPDFESQAAADREDSAVENFLASLVALTELAPVDVITTVSPDEAVVSVGVSKAERPVIAQASPSPKQEKMLSRKVREWSESLHGTPELASGLTWKHQGQEYLASFTQLPAADDMGIQRVIVEISTEEDGKRLSSKVHMKRLAFSNYAQFVNRWDPDVQIHNDELDGRFHSNTEISLAYDRKVKPLFHGKVTTTSRRINVTNSRWLPNRDQIFVGGLQTGVRSIRLPKQFLPFPSEAAITDDQVHHFAEDTRITFYADGRYVRQRVDSVSPPQVVSIAGDTTYLIADKKVKMYVKGTVNGKVLVYSPERIVIEDDLVYEQNPEEVPDADDYLGLVSDKYVDIALPDVTGPGDLFIHAAIYAKRRFTVKGYRIGENALLYLYGSLSVGSLSATEPRFYTRIRFDQRLEKLRPPGFPMTDRYEVESWDTTWNVEPIE
jgi:hypothetical protein